MSANPDPSVEAILRRSAEVLAGYLQGLPARCPSAPPRLIEAINYSLLAGGKRLRPALVLECFRACSGGAEISPSALAAAAAVELIHTFSLVHDDLPAMDDDDLRRGKPTNHKVFGEAFAILAGDAMVTLAFEILATDAEPNLSPKLIAELASAAGPCGMIGGQAMDIAGEQQTLDLNQLQQIHRKKTGAILTASCRMGAMCANANEATLTAITYFGEHLGLAFQIVDDLLDVTSSLQQLGKRTGKDARSGKNTYPALIGVEASRAHAAQCLEQAIAALHVSGSSADVLRQIATFVVRRDV